MRRFHSDSEFGPGPRRPLTYDDRRTWKAKIELARRAGRLTALHQLVAHALLKRLGQDGQLTPAHLTLAQDVGCSERTVRRALTALADLGLLRWVRRLVRSLWRAEQTSNAYELLIAGIIPVVARCGGQARRQTQRNMNLLPAFLPDLDQAKRALQQIRNKWASRFAATRA